MPASARSALRARFVWTGRASGRAGTLGEMFGCFVDHVTQRWVRATGQTVDLSVETWLDGPASSRAGVVADEWLAVVTSQLGGTQRREAGLLADLSSLSSRAFDPRALRPEVVDFYERTSRYRLDVWSQWSPLLWPGGWAISTVFARRLQQLSLPLRPLDVAYGIDSSVIAVDAADGAQVGAAWLRKVRATGQSIYSGWYGTTRMPASGDPVLRVVFPLPNGSCAVFLTPRNGADGSLVLESPLGPFGAPGAYLIVERAGGRASVRRIPIAETFRVFVDSDGVLRTDHHMRIWHATVVRLHYRMSP